MLINCVLWIVFGLIAGAAAKFIMPGKDPGGILVTAAIGIVGAPGPVSRAGEQATNPVMADQVA
jgi:uncharacterized membrane protein YeaQ/YmgE (transglycosylase-associated protein family)